MTIQHFIYRPPISACVQWDGTNNDELTAFAASFPHDNPPAATITWAGNVPTFNFGSGDCVMSVGDWLIYGNFQSTSNADFLAQGQLTGDNIVFNVSDYTG